MTTKWAQGLSNMISKTEARRDINDLMVGGEFQATRKNFTLLAKRTPNVKNWRAAVEAVVNKNVRDEAYEVLSCGDYFPLNKTELRRAANLT